MKKIKLVYQGAMTLYWLPPFQISNPALIVNFEMGVQIWTDRNRWFNDVAQIHYIRSMEHL